MIEQLMVKDYILFDHALVDFKNDMTVITGETGAGKSLLIDAITYLAGGRMTQSVVRQNKEKATLQMVIETDNQEVLTLLEENGYDVEDGLVIIQRSMSAQGKGSVRINQQVATLSFLKKVVSKLIDIHSQMDTIQLMDEDVQLEMLDQYADTKKELEETAQAYQVMHRHEKELEKAKNETYSDDELEYLTNALNEIQNAAIEEGELETLQDKIKELSKSQQNIEDLSETIYTLTKDNGILDGLYSSYKQLHKNGSFDEQADQLQNHYYQLQALSEQLSEKKEDILHEGDDLDQLQEREYKIKKLFRKYGGSYRTFKEKEVEFEEKIDRIIHRQDLFEKLEANYTQAKKQYDILAQTLSQKRQSVFEKLSHEIEAHCQDLMLSNARFRIDREEKKASKNGIDAIHFMVSMNPGQPFSTLKQSASGGELSRLMLALKTVFQTREGIDTIIFDEIDTGVSGKVALAMGNKMHTIAKEHQVLCITHLASVAVWADTHYLVKKVQEDEKTTTQIKAIDENERLIELATMANGEASESGIQSMKELRRSVQNG
ncbi:DNA repair protein RecN [Dubosiella newyorkensis]|jgi:DNA repair protein RecN (Recombination protein N)|uniref:DNA repair protein RecN n=1 Tax=Dubosiella newyorkensis TaxID=1862672 RepID=UPI0023520943|nr:DNA repair protein RecN [Dubosiella newyorkensis]MCI9040577.1 DNA repair protein RecN [Dubosiella newyorkensis]